MTIKVSQQQKDKTKVFEGFTTTPKKDTDGNYVIGYGVQVDPKRVGKISPDGAEKMFNDRYSSAEAELSPLITRPLSQNQQDALGDTHFNMGLTKMLKHGIIDLVNSGKDQEVAALFRRLNAAKIQATGKMEEVGNLPERANYRADLWLKPDEATAPPSPQAQAQVAAPATQRSSLIDEVEQYNTPEEAASTKQDLLGEVEQYAVNPAPSPQAQFDMATDISDPKQLDTQKKVQMISKQFQTPADVVEGMLMTEPEETVRTRLSSPGMAQNYPHTTEWASDPTNNALLKMTSDYPKKIEKATVKFNEQKPNWQKAIDSQFDRFEDSAVLAQMVFGSTNRQQGIQQLRQLDERRKMNVLTSPEIEEVKKSIQNLRTAFGEGWDQIAKINFGKDSTDNIVDLMKAAYGAGKITAEEAAAFMYTAANNPKAYGEFMMESSGAPIVAGVTGSLVGTPFVGAAATYTTSSVMAFGGKIREELEKFRSTKTNDIDYEAFFSDPARIARLRAEAVTYGLSIGAIETAFQFLGGRYLSKAIPKNPILATGATVAGGIVSEGVGETGARTLGQVVSGNPVDMKANAMEGIEEMASGGPLAGAGAIAQGAINAGVNYINSRKGTIKTSETLKESSKANEDVNDLSGLKETIKTNPAGKEHSENFEDLVTKAAEGGIKDPFNGDEAVITPEPTKEQVDAALKYGRDQAKTGTVSFTPSEWEAFNAARGMDPHEALGVFSPKTQAAYANNRESDTSIVIPVSEWAFATEEDPDIDQIVRINGNKYNNIEANELIDAFEKDPLVFFDTDMTSDSMEAIAEMSPESPIEMETQTVEGEGSTPMRPLNLTSEFSSQEEQEAFEGFRRRLNRALPSTIQPELADDISRILLRRFKLRAAIANLPLSEALNRLQFGRRLSEGKARAQMPTLEKDFFTVAFNKNDKASSVFHELAHVWLHEMAEDYQLLKDIDLNTAHGDVKAYREAMETARELFGIDSLDEILAPESEAKLTRIHETFAQTAEDYFMEGKSQNSRIQRLMDRMREWLAKHIDVLRKLNRKYPTVEINPKTEFMFDAILGATKASEDQVYAMFPDPAFTTEELGAGAAQYMSTFYDARSAAKAFLYGKAFKKKGLKENERIFETEYNRISKEAEEYVDALPSMNLRNQMYAAYHESKRKGLKGEETRISYESAQEYLTDGTDAGIAELKKNVPYFMLTGKKKGGISVPDLMAVLGVNSTEELRDMLIEANRREEMVQAIIDDMLKHETAPLLKSEDEMHQLAEDAVNGEGREKILKEEFKIFMEKHPNQFVRATSGLITSADSLPKTVKDLYKQESALQIGATPAHKFSALAYLNDMNRFRKESAKAYKARDFELAVDKKVKEAKAFYLYKEAVRAEREVAKARKQISNLSKVIKNKVLFQNTYDYEVVALAAKTVAQVKNGIPVEPFTREQLAPGSSLSDTDIDVINDRLSRLVGEPGGDNLTVNGSVALGEMAKSLLKISRDHKELQVEDEVKNLDAAVVEDLSKMNGNVVPFKRANQDKTSMLAAAKTSNTKMRGALDQMYKSTEEWATSHLGRLFSWLGSAEASSDIEKRELRKRLRKAMNKFPKGKMDHIIASERFEWMPFMDKTDSPIFWDSAKFKFDNMGQFITAMLYMGSESGAKKFLYGKGLANKANINTVVSDFWNMVTDKYNKNLISKEHLEFVAEAWKLLDEIHPRLAQVLYETQRFPMGKIEGWEVKTPIGTLKGGYYPVVHSKQISIEDMTKLLDGGSNLTDWVKAFPGKDTKMALDRTEFYGDVNMNLNALNAYIEAAMNTIHLRKPLQSISKFVNHPAFAKTMETRRPGLYDNMLKPWMERVKLQTYVDPKSNVNGINPLLRRLRQSTGISFFFLNKASIFRQTLGTLQAVPEIGPLHMSLGAANFALSPLTTYKRAIELSPMMKDRVHSSQTKFLSVVEDLNRANDLISKGNEGVEKVTYLPLQAAQSITDIMVWNAAYNKMIAREMSIQDAVSYADNVVKKTQGSSNISEMPNIQYGSEASKWFTQFSTVPLINYELVTDAYRRGEKNSIAANFAMSVALTISVLAPVAIDVLVSQGLFGDDDEKDKKDKDSMGELILKRGSGAALESFFPTVGKYAGSAIAYGEPSFSPSARKIDDNTAKALKALTAASKYSVDLTAYEKQAISEFLTIILGTATGVTLPYNAVGKMEVDNYKNLSDNEKRNLKMKRTIQRRRAKMSLGE